MRAILALLAAATISGGAVAAHGQPRNGNEARALASADRAEIIELSAHFDNSLDSEDAAKFVATFVPDGELVGFWGTSKGPEGLRQAHAFMLATFAKDKRHVVTNHEITINGDRATMFCYLTVFDRKALAVTGTATFTDELVRTPNGWRFARRTLRADPNVDPIIESLKAKK
jgi:hypothetical protein